MKNRVHKIYTTSPQDAITYGWLTSTIFAHFMDDLKNYQN